MPTIGNLRWLLLLSWGVYPVAFLLPLLNVGGADAWVGKQIGYSVADIVAKAIYGLIIYRVAKIKSYADDPTFGEVELSKEDYEGVDMRGPENDDVDNRGRASTVGDQAQRPAPDGTRRGAQPPAASPTV